MPTRGNKYDFDIDPGQPEGIREVIGSVSDISDAIELCFPSETSDAILKWGSAKIPINYKYDVSVIYEDIVELVRESLKNHEVEVYFCSNTFSGKFLVTPIYDELILEAHWDSVCGNKEYQLNLVPKITTNKVRFLGGWSRILENVLKVIEDSSLSSSMVRELDELRTFLNEAKGVK